MKCYICDEDIEDKRVLIDRRDYSIRACAKCTKSIFEVSTEWYWHDIDRVVVVDE